MSPLDTPLRNLLEKAVVRARDVAERGARAALERLAVAAPNALDSMSPDERALRVSLRAKQRQLGDFDALLAECAYEHWHRMLFARFLAENDLLMHPQGVPVTLDECDELAESEGAADGWDLAACYAARMLPGIFRSDDPVLQVRLAPEDHLALERIVDELPRAVFTADDSLGWVYQYWQSKKKDEVNASEEKISGKNIGPVTQLFTEPYMVQFLLHNTLGAWWLSRHPDEHPPIETPYLRTLDDGTPAAGSFDGWPDTAAEIRIMDPCCGSGHFLVTAFEIMQRFRMAEEGLSEAEAGDAVLRDNLFGLEIDARCTQIAAFALALAAWRRGGYRELPPLNVACSGLSLRGRREDWEALANGDQRLIEGMGKLHDLFQQAPDLGSLIDPRQAGETTLLSAGFAELQPLLEQALEREAARKSDDVHFAGVAAQGVAKAAGLLAGQYDLVCTNVPYLKRGRQGPVLAEFCASYCPDGKNDIATVFVRRCQRMTRQRAAYALVTPQNWRFLVYYTKFRRALLAKQGLRLVALLGPNAFDAISGEVVNVGLFMCSNEPPTPEHEFSGIDATAGVDPREKAALLREGDVLRFDQSAQLQNPDARVILDDPFDASIKLLAEFASCPQGLSPADFPHYGRMFWEVDTLRPEYHLWQSTASATVPYGGRHRMLLWNRDLDDAMGSGQAYVRGQAAWGKKGVAVSQMRSLPVTLYTGECFDTNTAVIVPNDPAYLPAIWAFCSSPDFAEAVRRIDQSLKVTNAALVKVPFDLEHWQKVAEERGPLPEPYSEDPTQWLFDGNPARTTEPLQVAVARLLGYRWPEQADDGLDDFIDRDGIVCLPSVMGEPAAADRLAALLAAAWGDEWTPGKVAELLNAADFAGKSLEEWLRDGFFRQHCALFHHRPFIWHIWDGRKDGFSALVNYHKLDRALLGRLIYTYVDDWVRRQRHADEQGVSGANARLVAAEDLQARLKLILEGEAPYDIFVRWKPLEEQPIGWEPDLNDGVRLNIRPFMEAGVLRAKPNIKWGKDRGKNPPGAPWGEERINDTHLSLDEKRKARAERREDR